MDTSFSMMAGHSGPRRAWILAAALLLAGAVPPVAAQTAEDAASASREDLVEKLVGVGVPAATARELAGRAARGDEQALAAIRAIFDAAADMALGGVDHGTISRVVAKIATSSDPGRTADELVGDAVARAQFGDDVADSVPPGQRGQFRDITRNLLEIQAELSLLGADAKEPEIADAIKEAARRGITSRADLKELVDRYGNQVLDRQGFSSKPGERLADRLDRVAAEQKATADAEKAKSKGAGGVTRFEPGSVGSRADG